MARVGPGHAPGQPRGNLHLGGQQRLGKKYNLMFKMRTDRSRLATCPHYINLDGIERFVRTLREINTPAGSVFDVHAVVAHGVVELSS